MTLRRFEVQKSSKNQEKSEISGSSKINFGAIFANLFHFKAPQSRQKSLSTHDEGIRDTLLTSKNTSVKKLWSYDTLK